MVFNPYFYLQSPKYGKSSQIHDFCVQVYQYYHMIFSFSISGRHLYSQFYIHGFIYKKKLGDHISSQSLGTTDCFFPIERIENR